MRPTTLPARWGRLAGALLVASVAAAAMPTQAGAAPLTGTMTVALTVSYQPALPVPALSCSNETEHWSGPALLSIATGSHAYVGPATIALNGASGCVTDATEVGDLTGSVVGGPSLTGDTVACGTQGLAPVELIPFRIGTTGFFVIGGPCILDGAPAQLEDIVPMVWTPVPDSSLAGTVSTARVVGSGADPSPVA